MDIYAKGQLSFLILNCLLDRDFYGLDILAEVKNRSNGRIELKKPSVYSNLTRMEKQGQVSSYMQASEVGPNRKYYSITEKGRTYYAELKAEFDRLGFDVFRDYVGEGASPATQTAVKQEPVQEETPAQVEQNDFFDFSAFTQVTDEKAEEPQETKETVAAVEEQQAEPVQVADQEPEQKDDAVFLTEQAVQEEPAAEYNQRLYDITKDFNKYRKNRSFAEDQMAIEETETSIQNSNDKQQQSLNDLKIALLASKGQTPIQNNESQPAQETEEKKDDGVFITTRVHTQTRRIDPPTLKIIPEETPLPAPKRDTTIDPSHKDIISQLYARSKGTAEQEEKTSQSQTSEAIYDYDDLQDYYRTQNIAFRAYTHERVTIKHNTNRLNAIVSGLTFSLMVIFSAVLFAILYPKHLTNPSTSFLYIILPGLYFIALCSDLYKLKATSWEPKAMLPQWFMWLMYLLSSGLIVGLNFLFGMAAGVQPFLTTLILPLLLLAALIPFRYYVKRFVYIKYYN